ncbi:hypothetical protein [Halorubrum sp. CBA1229]|uniref:hypothetical protein n=1 Tax=Halorubrum sp. CBA1229 TaxID=1853699 RepID=UPI0011CDEB3B|nr:hypothetical protein [Halorubrum sp. CBA1229]QKY18638.1 hypothetical protein Hrr1229_017155 [Halorubrum sp. CBA1229]
MADSEDEPPESLRLHVSIGNATVEVEGPAADAETWFEALREDFLPEVNTTTVETTASQPSNNPDGANESGSSSSEDSVTDKARSLPEYYKIAGDIIKRDRALLVGWYLEYHEDTGDFTSKEVESRAQDAKIGLGQNVSRDLSKQVQEGRLDVVDQRDGSDAYHLTRSGEEYVQEDLLSDLENS